MATDDELSTSDAKILDRARSNHAFHDIVAYKEVVELGMVEVRGVRTKLNIADLFTNIVKPHKYPSEGS